MGAIKVLLVDDSAVMRQVMTSILDNDPGIEVMGSASDPIFAMERMNKDWPDVIVLDVEMPRMDGITFLKKLMGERPTPVLIFSSLTERGAQTTIDAMSAGAFGFLTKPQSGLKTFLEEERAEIVRMVKSAGSSNVSRVTATSTALKSTVANTAPSKPISATNSVGTHTLSTTTERVIAIGTSTGGTLALELVLRSLPLINCGVVIVQHMPEKFTAAFASRLDALCESKVMEASDGDRILPGHALIAPGGRHMTLERSGAQYRVHISDGPRVNRHIPSIDVLFQSVARHAGRNALGVIMTGMGDDGARGLLKMREAGAETLGQDENTCVVYGMPQVAFRIGAVQQEVPLTSIASLIQQFAGRR